MPKASVKRLIECKKDLINLVLDIEKYPQFVPFCYDAKIYENKNEGDLQKIIADLTIGKGPFKDTYKSDVSFNKKDDDLFLLKTYRGTIKNILSNNWKFIYKNNGITEVTFDIDFEIKNKFLNSLMVVSFQFGLEKIADAFQKELRSYSVILRIKSKAFLTVAFCIDDLFLLLNKHLFICILLPFLIPI